VFVDLRTVQENVASGVILPQRRRLSTDASEAAQISDRLGGSGQ
jgi:hypothetical protein